MKVLLLFLSVISLNAAGACLPVIGDRILGGDLALGDARFSALSPSLIVGSAPAPGTKRTFTAYELGRIARANGIGLSEPVEMCFEIPMRQLDREEVLTEMRRALPDADVVISELSTAPVPAGKPEFPANGLEPARGGTTDGRLWHGYVRYSDTKRTPVWARVNISQTLIGVVAQRDLRANVPINAGALSIGKLKVAPVTQPVALRMSDVEGKIPQRTLKAGEFIPLALLETAPDIRRGDSIRVDVLCGPARLQIDAIAEKDARNGDLLELRNPSSGKTFRARLDGSRAVIVVPTGPGL